VKKLLTVLTVIMFVCSFSSVALAEMSADDIIAKHIEKTGGAENYKKMKSMKMEGKFLGQGSGDITLYQMKPNKHHMHILIQGMDVIIASDGEKIWSKFPMVPGYVFTEEADLEAGLEEMMMNPYLTYKERGVKVKTLGVEKVKATDCYKVEYVKAAGDTSFVYFNKETFNIVKQTSPNSEVLFAKFKDFEGFTMPTKMTMVEQGQRNMIVFNNIELNVDLNDSLFTAPPDSLAAPPEILEQLKQMQGGE
jgi:outer membrane lipoprotein-sorting protein